MTDTSALALLRDAENYLSALHGSVARHDHLAANLACAGCELRDRITAALPELAAAPAAVESPADRAAVLRKAAQHLYTALFPAVYNDLGQKAAEGVNRAVSELRRMADETATTETPSMQLARQSVQAMADTLQRPDEPDDTLHACPGRWGGPDCRCFDDEPAAGARQDGATP